MKNVFLFPGQGAQFVGMGKEIYDANPIAKELFTKANEIVGYDIAKLCFSGPDTELNKTNVCQPAILVMSIVSLNTWAEKPTDLYASAGLSLGEYTALVSTGALSFEDAVHLVERRGTFMQECCDKYPSGMVSVLGMELAKVKEILQQVHGVIGVANLNSPGQIVISGDNKALEEASALLKTAGAKRTIPLKVAGAFHSPLMKEAEDKLKIELSKVKINTPLQPVVSNVTADYVRTPDEIKDCLGKQVTNPVLWEDSMKRLVKDGVKDFYEIGPGSVLTSLLQKIDSSVVCKKV
jgi:[acyl-carrier-protein] S-malonyltransferase